MSHYKLEHFFIGTKTRILSNIALDLAKDEASSSLLVKSSKFLIKVCQIVDKIPIRVPME